MTTYNQNVQAQTQTKTRTNLGIDNTPGGKISRSTRAQRSDGYGNPSSSNTSGNASNNRSQGATQARRVDGSGNYGNPMRNHVDVTSTEVPGSKKITTSSRLRSAASNAKNSLGKGISSAKGVAGKTAGAVAKVAGKVSPGVGINAKGDIDFGLRAGGIGVSISAKGDVSLGVAGIQLTINPRDSDDFSYDFGLGAINITSTREGCTIIITTTVLGKITNQQYRQADECKEPSPDPPKPKGSTSPSSPINESDLPPKGSDAWTLSTPGVETMLLQGPCYYVWAETQERWGVSTDPHFYYTYDEGNGWHYSSTYYWSFDPGISYRVPYWYHLPPGGWWDTYWKGVSEIPDDYVDWLTWQFKLLSNQKIVKIESTYTSYSPFVTDYIFGSTPARLSTWNETTWYLVTTYQDGREIYDDLNSDGWYQNSVNQYYDRFGTHYLTTTNLLQREIIKLDIPKRKIGSINPKGRRGIMDNSECCEITKRIYKMLGGDQFYNNGLSVPTQMFTPGGSGLFKMKNYHEIFNIIFRTFSHRTPGEIEFTITDTNKGKEGNQSINIKTVNAQGYYTMLLKSIANLGYENTDQMNVLVRLGVVSSQIMKLLVIINQNAKNLLSFFDVPTKDHIENVDIPFDLSLGGSLQKGFKAREDLQKELLKIVDQDTEEAIEGVLDKFLNEWQMPTKVQKLRSTKEGGNFWYFLKQLRS